MGESRVRDFKDKQPNGTFTVVDGCHSADCCAKACCNSPTVNYSVCDTWALSNDNKCHIGKADNYTAAPGWSGRSLDEALCSSNHHLRKQVGLRPFGLLVGGGMQAVPSCKDADCCQEACCDHKDVCQAWAFSSNTENKHSGCLMGTAEYWVEEDGWIGYSLHALHPPTQNIEHTGSPFEGPYKLVVTAEGEVTAQNLFGLSLTPPAPGNILLV